MGVSCAMYRGYAATAKPRSLPPRTLLTTHDRNAMYSTASIPKVNTQVLDDVSSAMLILRVIAGESLPSDAPKKLKPDWLDGMTIVGQDGESGLSNWLAAVEDRDRGQADVIRAALTEAKANPPVELAESATRPVALANDPN